MTAVSWPLPGSSEYAAETAAVIGNLQSGVVNAANEGVIANGVTDNLTAMQNSINRSLSGTNPATGIAYIDLPPGDIAIDGSLDIPFCTGFEVRGKGKGISRIVQQADNTPILNFTTDPYSHTVRLCDFSLTYANQQGPGDTNSAAILVGGDATSETFNWLFERLWISNAYRGIYADTSASVCAMWGAAVRDCTMTSLQAAAIKAADTVGKPNWRLENFFISNANGGPSAPSEAALTFSGTSELVIQNLDIEGWNGRHMDINGSESPVLIDGYHMENSTWAGSGDAYINAIDDGGFIARCVTVSGVVDRSGGDVYVFASYGGTGALCQIEGMNGALTLTSGGAYPLRLDAGATGYVRGIRDGTYTDNPINTGHAGSVSGLIMTNGTIH